MNKKNEARSTLEAMGFVSGIGLQLAITIAVCVFIGKKADEQFSFGPWGTLAGIILGFTTGIWAAYKKLLGKVK